MVRMVYSAWTMCREQVFIEGPNRSFVHVPSSHVLHVRDAPQPLQLMCSDTDNQTASDRAPGCLLMVNTDNSIYPNTDCGATQIAITDNHASSMCHIFLVVVPCSRCTHSCHV